MKYDVHIFPIVRIKIGGIEARTQAEAIERAINAVDLSGLFRGLQQPLRGDILLLDTEYADEISHALVDEAGDEEHEKSKWYYWKNGQLIEGIEGIEE